jgi:hypothetical protein
MMLRNRKIEKIDVIVWQLNVLIVGVAVLLIKVFARW